MARTQIRLLDKWQEYKARILQLAATMPSTQPLLVHMDDMDEGCVCALFSQTETLQYSLHLHVDVKLALVTRGLCD